MVRQRFVRVALAALVVFLLIPRAASPQSATGIAGVARDGTGAVLPGVTVEASSPALIEKVRTTVTDGQGLYRITELRPGSYVVTFTLPGFSTVRREGIELTTLFVAAVNVEMSVGNIQETITVSGQSPAVDVQNVVVQRTVTAEVADTLPTGKSFQNLAALIPGLVMVGGNRPSAQDVAGSAGERTLMAIHGGRTSDMTYQVDGVTYNTLQNAGASSGFTPNTGEIAEYGYEVGALSAETSKGGIRVNMIPKEGGNAFHGILFGAGTNQNLVSDNLSEALQARGLQAGNVLDKIWDLNLSVGGPIKQDKLWYFTSFRYWGLSDLVAGMYYDTAPRDNVYTPDLSRQADDDSWNTSEGLRLTWQATRKDKFSGYFNHAGRCQCHQAVSATRAPEASRRQVHPHLWLATATYSSTISSRLLLETGWLRIKHHFYYEPVPGTTSDMLAIVEQSTGLNYRAAANGYQGTLNYIDSFKTALSYVTGSHAFKAGVQLRRGARDQPLFVHGDIVLRLLNGVPSSVQVWATPNEFKEKLNAELGIFAQDQWTLRRLTLNAGVRYDHLNASVLAQQTPPAQFVPARNFAPVPNVPNWHDVSPRLGASYDLFGDAKTALKVTLSRYVAGEALDLARANNPLQTSVNNATRTWNDLNGDFLPQPNELGSLSNTSFGQVVIRTRYDEAVLQGFDSRGYNWETTAAIQHELVPRVAVNLAYYRRTFGNFNVTDNLAVTPADYDQYCITAPVDARLPGGGGNQICGLYDVTPAKFGQFNELVTRASNFGKQTEVYDGIDFAINARLPYGAFLQAGTSTGRSKSNNCFVVDSPQQLQFCDVRPPFQTQLKALASFNLPWGLQVSGTYQGIPGPEITATQTVRSSTILPSLGRNLASGPNGTAVIPLISRGTLYEGRLDQVDVRAVRIFRVGAKTIRGMFDVYNLFNGSAVLVLNSTYGPAWQQPSYILPGRMLKFAAQMEF